MSKNDDDRSSALKVLDVLDALSAYTVSGVSNTALSRQLNLSASAVTRAINVLEEKGWARKDEHAWSIPKGEFEPGEDPAAVAVREFTEDAFAAAPEPKELLVIDDCDHVDLYDNKEKIPFAKVAGFFETALGE